MNGSKNAPKKSVPQAKTDRSISIESTDRSFVLYSWLCQGYWYSSYNSFTSVFTILDLCCWHSFPTRINTPPHHIIHKLIYIHTQKKKIFFLSRFFFFPRQLAPLCFFWGQFWLAVGEILVLFFFLDKNALKRKHWPHHLHSKLHSHTQSLLLIIQQRM